MAFKINQIQVFGNFFFYILTLSKVIEILDDFYKTTAASGLLGIPMVQRYNTGAKYYE